MKFFLLRLRLDIEEIKLLQDLISDARRKARYQVLDQMVFEPEREAAKFIILGRLEVKLMAAYNNAVEVDE